MSCGCICLRYIRRLRTRLTFFEKCLCHSIHSIHSHSAVDINYNFIKLFLVDQSLAIANVIEHNSRWIYQELPTTGSCIYVNGIFEVIFRSECVTKPKSLCLHSNFVCKFQPVLYFYHLSGQSTQFGSSMKLSGSQPMKSKARSRNVS